MVKERLQVAVILFLSVLSCSVVAQSGLGPRTSSPKDKAVEDKYRSDEIERVRRSTVKPDERRTSHFPQIKDDFERIQVINNAVLQSDSNLRQSDYPRIAKAAGDINKRATRLKSNLFPTTAKDSARQIEEKIVTQRDFRLLLIALDNAIVGFVHNPIFENLRVVNPQDSDKAQKDLESIIKLSREVNKRAKARDQ
jgi:hypothetical protein